MRKYYSFDEAIKMMRTGQVMGGGAEFDYYFMIDGEIYGGFSCDYDRYEIEIEKEKKDRFYVIHDMTNECYLDWIKEGDSQIHKLADQRREKMNKVKVGFRAVLFKEETKMGSYPIRPTYKQAIEDIEFENQQINQYGTESAFTHAKIEKIYYRG